MPPPWALMCSPLLSGQISPDLILFSAITIIGRAKKSNMNDNICFIRLVIFNIVVTLILFHRLQKYAKNVY